MSAATSHLWSEGQKKAFKSLLEIGDLFFFTDWADLAIKPRLAPLVIGQSGAGKSHVVREMATELGVPFLRLTASNWVVSGVKDITPTLLRVHQFISDNDQGILHFDELDKFRAGTSDWSQYVLGEMFDLLDRAPTQPIKDVKWSPDILQKLKHDFWMVGSGTWQQVWLDSAKAKVGFGSVDDSNTLVANVRRSVETTDVIPQELLRRFNRDLIVLPPATEADYRHAAENLGLARLASELKMRLDFAAAARSSLGARWLEETCAQLLLQAKRENRTDLLRLRPYVPENSPGPEDDDIAFGFEDSVL